MISSGRLRDLIARAADASDGDDVATRRLLANELGALVTACPHAGDGRSTADELIGADGAADLCALGGHVTPACHDCLLSREEGVAFA
jgi:hypothetical protein